MVNFDVGISKPDHDFMRSKAEDWATRGFKFNTATWQDVIDEAYDTRTELHDLGLENPNSPKDVTYFLRSFNSLEIASLLYDLAKGRWVITVESLRLVSQQFNIRELDLLYKYKVAQATASAYISLERHLDDGIAYPKVNTTMTNRVMFTAPNITGLPKRIKPFLPTNPDALLVSVDVKSQEPALIIYFYGSDRLKSVLSSDKDMYLAVARLAFGAPKVKCFRRKSDLASDNLTTSAVACGRWEFSNKDYIVAVKNVSGNPTPTVKAICASGATKTLPVTWHGSDGIIDTDRLTYVLSDEEREEVKAVWNVTAYGGSYATVTSLCKLIDAESLSRFIRSEIRTNFKKDALYTCFGTKLTRPRGKAWQPVLLNTVIQATGADIMALLVEHFYSLPDSEREGIDIYFTRYDEIVVEISETCIEKHGPEGVCSKLQEFFGHSINNELIFDLEIKMF